MMNQHTSSLKFPGLKQKNNKKFPEVDKLGGGFKYVLFSPLFGEDSHFD